MKSLKIEFNNKPILILYNNNDIWFRSRNVSNLLEKNDIREYISKNNIKRLLYFDENLMSELSIDQNSRFIHENGILEFIKKEENISDKDVLENLIEFVKNEIILKELQKDVNILDYIKENNIVLSDNNQFLKLWGNLDNKDEILVTSEMLEFIGFIDDLTRGKDCHTSERDKKRRFIEFLDKNNIEYENIDRQHEKAKLYKFIQDDIKKANPHTLHSKRWILMSIDNFKEAIIMLNNKKSKIARKYLIQVEKVFKEYSNFIYERKIKLEKAKSIKEKRDLSIQIEERDDKIKSLELFKNNTENFIINVKSKNKNGYIYIFTTKQYAANNRFKIGRTINMENRKYNYNSSHVSEDEFYACYMRKTYNVIKVENLILDILEDFRDSKHKEFINMHFTYLKEIIDMIITNMSEPYDYINNLIKNKLIHMYEMKPLIPEKIDTSNEIILIDEIKEKLNIFIEKYKNSDKFTLYRKELFDILNMNEDKKTLWKLTKQIFGWVSSNTFIKYNNLNFKIIY